LLFAAVVYFGLNIGEHYFNFYQYQDAMRQEARFSYERTDEQITKHLSALADTLELPVDANLITILRSTSNVNISSDYDEVIRLPFKQERVLHFHPSGDNGP